MSNLAKMVCVKGSRSSEKIFKIYFISGIVLSIFKLLWYEKMAYQYEVLVDNIKMVDD